jgi:tetratricopeptide (TPR) repeat protein
MADSSAEELIARGFEARRENRLEDSWLLFREAVHRCRKAKDKRMLAEALAGLGQVERDEGKTQAALRHYGEAVELLRKEGDGRRLAHAIRHVADIERGHRNWAKAGAHYEEALAFYRAHEETPALELANALRGYALQKGETGEDEEAKYLWYEAKALYEHAGVEAGVAESQSHIAFLLGR